MCKSLEGTTRPRDRGASSHRPNFRGTLTTELPRTLYAGNQFPSRDRPRADRRRAAYRRPGRAGSEDLHPRTSPRQHRTARRSLPSISPSLAHPSRPKLTLQASGILSLKVSRILTRLLSVDVSGLLISAEPLLRTVSKPQCSCIRQPPRLKPKLTPSPKRGGSPPRKEWLLRTTMRRCRRARALGLCALLGL